MTQKLLLCALTCAVSLQAAQPIAANAATHRVFGNKWLQTVNLFRGQNTDALFAAQDNNTGQPALSLSTSHFEVGQAIDIQFKNLPEGASICLFKDKGPVAIKTQYKQSADGEQNGTFNVGNDLDEGDYTVRCLDAKGKTLIMFSDDLDKALATFVLANGAAATGQPVTIFFTFWGLSRPEKGLQ